MLSHLANCLIHLCPVPVCSLVCFVCLIFFFTSLFWTACDNWNKELVFEILAPLNESSFLCVSLTQIISLGECWPEACFFNVISQTKLQLHYPSEKTSIRCWKLWQSTSCRTLEKWPEQVFVEQDTCKTCRVAKELIEELIQYKSINQSIKRTPWRNWMNGETLQRVSKVKVWHCVIVTSSVLQWCRSKGTWHHGGVCA